MADEDVILVEYQGKINDLEKKLDKLEKDMLGVDVASKKSMGTLDKESKKAAVSVDKVDKEVKGFGNTLSDLAGKIPGVFAVQEVLGYGNAIKGAAVATGGMTSAMKILRASIIATGIGALAIALLALIAYFKRTDEGATKLEGIMGALGAATNEVTGFIAELGSKVYDAMQSFEDFKTLALDVTTSIGKYILNRIGAPIFLIIDLFKLAKKGFSEGFDGLGTEFADALLRFTTGFEDLATSTGKFADRIAKAAKEAYEFALAMDAISDAQRDLNVELSANEKRIVELIRQSKSHARSEEERKSLLKEANALEESGLNKQLDLENKKLKLIQDRNRRELGSINQGKELLLQQLDSAKTDAERFAIKTKLLSINDDLAQEEADQQIKINNIEKASIALKEKNLNSIAALDEEILQNHLANIKATGIAEENIYKEQFANRLINEEELQKGLANAQIDSLLTQKAFLIEHGRETVEIDKAIQDIRVKQVEEADKKILDEKIRIAKELTDFRKAESDYDDKLRAERDKKEIEDEKKKQALKMQILNDAVATAQNFANKEIQRSLEKKQAVVNAEIAANQKQTDAQAANIDKLLEKGLISEEQAAIRKEVLAKKAAKKDYELKKKVFESQKKADEQTAGINTAVAILKAFATYGPTPAGFAAAAFAAAEGLIEIGFISSRKYPAFKDGVIDYKGKGTGTSDENLVLISNRESIITAKATMKHKGLLQAINNDTVEKYLTSDGVSPIIAKQQKAAQEKEDRLAQTALNLATIAGNQLDTSHMEMLLRRNKKVGFEDRSSAELARMIGKEIGRNHNPEMK